MNADVLTKLIYLLSAVLFISGLKRMTKVRDARGGNALASLAMALAIVGALIEYKIMGIQWVLIGAAIGGLIGRSLHHNIDKGLVNDVTNDLKENTSALFVIGTGSAAAVVGALEPYKGKVYQTTLDAETEAQIQSALDKAQED